MTYIDKKKFFVIFILILIIVLLLLMIVSTTIGAAKEISNLDAIKIILNQIPVLNRYIDIEGIPAYASVIILKIRLPRVILGALVGAGLAVAGAALQGMFKNPMADPYIIGVSSGAAFGATIAVFFGLGYSFLGFSSLGLMAFIGATVTTFVVYSIARIGSKVPITTLLLSGIAVSSFLSAVISFLMLFNREQVQTVVFWLMGSLTRARWQSVYTSAPGIIIGIIILLLFSKDLNIMLLGDEAAQHLGMDVEKVKKVLLVVCSLIAGSAVAVSGIIGFVGLIIPHVVRLIFGPDHRSLLPISALGGAVFLVLADIIARSLIQPIEIPVGVITALFGGPFFIYMLKKKKRAVY